MNLEQKIEAILFYKNEPLEIKVLSKLAESSEKEVKEALKNLALSLENRGISLIITDTEVGLATTSAAKEFIEKITKEEMSKEIGKAGLETLAIVLYNGPVSRREIDYIRGVNSTFIIRHLCIRGLIDKIFDNKDQRIPKYKGSVALLAHLGINTFDKLPQFKEIKEQLEKVKTESNNQDEG